MRRASVALLAALAGLTGCAGATRGNIFGIDDTGAQLSGHVESNRTETGSYWFEWGRTPALGHESVHTPIDFTAGQFEIVWHALNNREPETTYYWRLCADDQDPQYPNPNCSDVGSFTTTAPPPGKALELDGGWDIVENPRDGAWNSEGPLTFEGPAVLTLLDSYCASDRWRVFDNGEPIGRTPAVEDLPGCHPYVLTLQESLEDPEHYSRGSFTLGPGAHSIRLKLLAGTGNLFGNTGYIRVDSLN